MASFRSIDRAGCAGRWRVALALASAAALAACAGYSPSQVKTGQTAEEVAQSMGKPTAIYSMPDGKQRIEYARGPMGKQTFMVDMDASGRVAGWVQVLTEPNFESLKVGTPQDEVLRKLGRPTSHMRVRFKNSDVWNYRYDSQGYCRWFQVSVGESGKVVDTGYGPDPQCDPGGREPKDAQ